MTHSSAIAAVRPDVVLAFTGDDAQAWLSGQATNDLTTLFEDKASAVYTLFVTAKGRILADAWVTKNPDGVLQATVPEVAVEALLEHFDRYIIMEDVEVEQAELAVLSLINAKASVVGAVHQYRAHDLGAEATHLLVPKARAQELLVGLRDNGIETLDEQGWVVSKIAAGEPRFGYDFSEEHYPQEAGLGSSAVSFNKGCYIGQEVVCMLENRGKFRRQLVHFRLEEPIEKGAEIKHDGQAVGSVSSAASRDDMHFAIGMVTRKALEEPGEVRVGTQTPSSLQPIGRV